MPDILHGDVMVDIMTFIPARGGSERVPLKNIRTLNGHPLIAYTIQQARNAGIGDKNIYVTTDDPQIAQIACYYGASVIHRPPELATRASPDHEWVFHAIHSVEVKDIIVILRPTSPFRRPSSIVHGIEMLIANPTYDSVRAIRPVRDHPCKMWRYLKFDDYSGRIIPFLPQPVNDTPSYDMPTQAYGQLWVQSGALQVHRVSAMVPGNISGDKILGLCLGDIESLDINTPLDWTIAKLLAESDRTLLTQPTQPPMGIL